jgi:hypothetical protein
MGQYDSSWSGHPWNEPSVTKDESVQSSPISQGGPVPSQTSGPNLTDQQGRPPTIQDSGDSGTHDGVDTDLRQAEARRRHLNIMWHRSVTSRRISNLSTWAFVLSRPGHNHVCLVARYDSGPFDSVPHPNHDFEVICKVEANNSLDLCSAVRASDLDGVSKAETLVLISNCLDR